MTYLPRVVTLGITLGLCHLSIYKIIRFGAREYNVSNIYMCCLSFREREISPVLQGAFLDDKTTKNSILLSIKVSL
jgi:hypothetical protein